MFRCHRCVFLLPPIVLMLPLCVSNSTLACESPQYLEEGKTGIVHCSFPVEFFGVLWYDSSVELTEEPIIYYQQSSKGGAGLDSGEYDICLNGSLVIRTVSLHHEGPYRVTFVQSQKVKPVKYEVFVIVLVKPVFPCPVIQKCGNESDICLTISDNSGISCSVHDIRPNITLEWRRKTAKGSEKIPADTFASRRDELFTIRTTTISKFSNGSSLNLLECKANGPPLMFEKDKSYIFVEHGREKLPKNSTRVVIERNKNLKLNCPLVKDTAFIVWKKEDTNKNMQELLLYSVFIGEGFARAVSGNFEMGVTGSLLIREVNVQHEGVYTCIRSDGIAGEVTEYDVNVYVVPVPAYPSINGCNHQQYCVLEVGHLDSLTCTITGIRPLIQLELITSHQKYSDVISFEDKQTDVKHNGDTFDVSITSKIRVKKQPVDRKYTLECCISEVHFDGFDLKTRFDILVSGYYANHTERPTPDSRALFIISIPSKYAIAFTVIGVFFVSLLVTFICFKNRLCKDGQKSDLTGASEGENKKLVVHPPDPDTEYSEGKTQLLVSELKETYEEIYKSFQPIPYIKEWLCSVSEFYVESGVQQLVYEECTRKRMEWINVNSCDDIITQGSYSATRRILEGDAGYGKSTLALHFAYEWSNRRSGSPLCQVDVFILLKLRDLDGTKSIYEAIITSLLDKKSNWQTNDVETILHNKSVVLVLDGYDEYSDRDNPKSDIEQVISKKILKRATTVLMTRTSILPKQFHELTKRFRLTGFNEKARRNYILKAVVGNDEEAANKLEKQLKINVFLDELGHFPLCFVILAHIRYKCDTFGVVNSFTELFKNIMSWFDSHMENKKIKDYVPQNKWDQIGLGRVAFQYLSGKRAALEKKVFIKHMNDKDKYNQFIRLGVIVEESVRDISDMQPKISVRFNHKIFCEWFAANYISKRIKKRPVTFWTKLKNLNPSYNPYVFIFVCGLGPEGFTFRKIISYLESKGVEGDKCAVSCILEQSDHHKTVYKTLHIFCRKGFIISGHDSLQLQRSYLEILKIASRLNIVTEYVELYNCTESVDFQTGEIVLESGLRYSSEWLVKELDISLTKAALTAEHAEEILKFSTRCSSSLKTIWFGDCVPPFSFNDQSALESLDERKIQVKWKWDDNEQDHIYNVPKGRWQTVEDPISCPSKTDFKKMLEDDEKHRKKWTEETFKKWVNASREDLR